MILRSPEGYIHFVIHLQGPLVSFRSCAPQTPRSPSQLSIRSHYLRPHRGRRDVHMVALKEEWQKSAVFLDGTEWDPWSAQDPVGKHPARSIPAAFRPAWMEPAGRYGTQESGGSLRGPAVLGRRL